MGKSNKPEQKVQRYNGIRARKLVTGLVGENRQLLGAVLVGRKND